MPTFIDENGRGYDTDFNPGTSPPEGAVEVSKADLLRFIEGQNAGKIFTWNGGTPVLMDRPPPTHTELVGALRVYRDVALLSTDFLVLRHRDQVDAGGATTLSADLYRELLTYRQELRDLPENVSDKALADPKAAIPLSPV